MYDRSKSIGASDAVLIHEGKWAELYDRKTSSEPFTAPLPARIGHALEELNRDIFVEETKIPIEWRDEWRDTPITHVDYPWMKYLPDGMVGLLDPETDEITQYVPWEGKAVNMMWKPANLIKKYTPQLLHQMRVMNAPFAYFSVLYLNNKWERYIITYDEPAADELLEQEKLFMFMLERGIRPPEFQGKRKGWV